MDVADTLKKACTYLALQYLAKPTVELIARAKTDDERVKYFSAYRSCVRMMLDQYPEAVANVSADYVARKILDDSKPS